MKSILTYIKEMEPEKWDYYSYIDMEYDREKAFVTDISHIKFIINYFKRSGKSKLLDELPIDINQLRYPDHINSVFFLGSILYHNVKKFQTYKPENNPADYETFPFLWFLIALFHDYAYEIEAKRLDQNIQNIESLLTEYNIDYFLFTRRNSKQTIDLLDLREDYFIYRLKSMKVLDHGIVAGLLLFDRLVKIRRDKFNKNDKEFFWGKDLEEDYSHAADAISLHNIWLANADTKRKYYYYNLKKLTKPLNISYEQFPLFYLLGVVDTIEPLKTYNCIENKNYILDNILMEFGANSVLFMKKEGAVFDFKLLKVKTVDFNDWLNLEIIQGNDFFKLVFK